MQFRHRPVLDARYWVAILVASVFGANMGDLFAHDLGLGHAEGLLPLALCFAGVLIVERRSRLPGELFYWLAIVIVRTAATNLGDLATHDFKVSYPLTIVVLAAVLALIWWLDRRRRSAVEGGRLEGVDLAYWAAMLTAGTFGTAAGDFVADQIGLSVSCLATLALVAALLTVRISAGWAGRASYWVVIAAIRTAGTNAGDWLAGRHGLAIGLPVDTLLTGLLLIGVLLLWPRRATLGTGAAGDHPATLRG